MLIRNQTAAIHFSTLLAGATGPMTSMRLHPPAYFYLDKLLQRALKDRSYTGATVLSTLSRNLAAAE